MRAIYTTTGIGIGFELPGYTYTEPMFKEPIDQFFISPTGLSVNGPIYLVKENNITSEQTFLVSIQVTDSAPSGTSSITPATLEADYRLTQTAAGQTSVTISFLAFEQSVLFPFTLFPDTFPEGTEAFQASISPETLLNSKTLASEIFIFIEDDDRKFEHL